MIDKAILEDIKSAVSIQEIASSDTTLKRNGNTLKGKCPFHAEKTPSFFIYKEKKYFKCFGCSTSGDVFDYLCRKENKTFIEVVKDLAKRANITLPNAEVKETHKKELKVLHFAAMYYNLALHNNKLALNYLTSRNLSTQDIDDNLLGYDDGGLYKSATKQEIDPKLFKRAGIPEFGFRDRIIFPIKDSSNDIIAFGARTLTDKQPKYINSPNSKLFTKNINPYMHRDFLHAASTNGEVIITEGYFDALSAWRANLPHTIAVNGTAISNDLAQMIAKVANTATLALDNDKPGVLATNKAIDTLVQAGLHVKVFHLPTNKDLHQAIEDKLQIQIKDITEYLLQPLLHDKNYSPETLTECYQRILNTLQRIHHPEYKNEIATTIANQLNFPKSIFSNN